MRDRTDHLYNAVGVLNDRTVRMNSSLEDLSNGVALSRDYIRDLAGVLSAVRNDTSDAFTGLREELRTGLAPLLEAVANPSPPAPHE